MKKFKNKFHTWEFRTHYITDYKEIPNLTNVGLCGLDIETSKQVKFLEHPQAGLCPHLSNIRLVQVYDGVGNVYVFDLLHLKVKDLPDILTKNRFVAHNAIFEISHFLKVGLPDLNIGCSMLLSQLIDGAERSPWEPDEMDEENEDQTGLARYRNRGHSLSACVERLFGVKVAKEQQVSDWNKEELSQEQIIYASLDAVLTYQVAKKLVPTLKKYKMERAYSLLKDTQHVIASMQLEGIPVDWEYHAKLIKTWEKELKKSLKACKPFFGETNIGSSKQLGVWLEAYFKGDKLKLASWPKTSKGAYGFGKTAITPLKHFPPVAALLEYRKWAKLVSTYGDSLLEKKHPITGRISTSYTLGQTTTGRLSSKNPNVQNFPRDKEFRDMFAAPKDHSLVVADYNAIELRLQAEFSKDPVMNKAFKEETSLYKVMASFLFNTPVVKITDDQRFVGKTTMLGLAYGMGPKKQKIYAENAGAKTHPQPFWDKAHKTYHSTFRVYSNWCNVIRKRAEQLGYIETLLGKRRKLMEEELYTRAPNTVIQGSAAELMMKALCICHKKIQGVGKIVATIHDEILIVCPTKKAEKAKKILEDSMNEAMQILFPKAVSTHVADAAHGTRWGEIKEDL